ncbi:MAG: hypothetical protein ACQEQV_04735 [Fibrobacterota bacterium]
MLRDFELWDARSADNVRTARPRVESPRWDGNGIAVMGRALRSVRASFREMDSDIVQDTR